MLKKLATVTALMLVLGVAAVAEAGRVGGRGSDRFTIGAGQSVTYNDRFYGNELAEVVIRGDGRTTLDAFLYDETGRLVARTDGPGDQIRLQWTPNVTSTYRLVVINRGAGPNTYTLQTN